MEENKPRSYAPHGSPIPEGSVRAGAPIDKEVLNRLDEIRRESTEANLEEIGNGRYPNLKAKK